MDVNGDGLTDIMVSQTEAILVLLQSYNNETKTKSFNDVRRFDEFMSSMDVCYKTNSTRRLTNPHYIHIADLNHDCVPDLFITTENKGYKQAELYLQVMDPKTEKFRYCMTYV